MDIPIVSFITLIFLELILSIDNLIFISTLMLSVEKKYRLHIKIIGLSFAFAFRVLFLLLVNYLVKLNTTLFSLMSLDFSYKEMLFLTGGLFLIYKSGKQVIKIVFNLKNMIEDKMQNIECIDKKAEFNKKIFFTTICQIILIDCIFSLDSVIVAVALVPDVKLIILAVMFSMIFLLFSIDKISDLLSKYQNIRLLAMTFILVLGFVFVLNGFSIYISKSYINTALISCVIFSILDNLRIKNANK
jgi:predicted tellurium resistance membrane protein TerC